MIDFLVIFLFKQNIKTLSIIPFLAVLLKTLNIYFCIMVLIQSVFTLYFFGTIFMLQGVFDRWNQKKFWNMDWWLDQI